MPDKSQQIVLSDNLTIATVEALHEELESALSSGVDIVFDGSQVQRCDTAGLQTLLAFKLELEKHSHQLSWKATSENLSQVSGLLGLEQALGL
ncbi:MAG: STAS domain-containing protein [Cellvibrionaceae bacterium]